MNIIQHYINMPISPNRQNKSNACHGKDGKKTDKQIKHCPNCGKCWEIDEIASRFTHNKREGKIVYLVYENFPTYGKEVKECPRCQ